MPVYGRGDVIFLGGLVVMRSHLLQSPNPFRACQRPLGWKGPGEVAARKARKVLLEVIAHFWESTRVSGSNLLLSCLTCYMMGIRIIGLEPVSIILYLKNTFTNLAQ